MARPRSRFAARARARPPARRARRAGSVQFPAGPSLSYRKAVRGLVRSVLAAVERVVEPALQQFAYQPPEERQDASDVEIFSRLRAAAKPSPGRLRKVTTDAASRIDRHVEVEIQRIGIPIESVPGIAAKLASWRKQNTQLINSLLGGQVQKIERLLAENQNRRVEALREQIQEVFQVTESKADLLARDQTLTLNSQIVEARQTAAGIEEFIWVTSGDERTRASHEELDGERFRWDDPPEVDGELATPGRPINCRCTAYPILPETE